LKKETHLIIKGWIAEGIPKEMLCGNCRSIIYGYDEEICPSCGSFINMNNVKEEK